MRGGKREGAGRKAGAKGEETLAKEVAREAARAIITRELEPLIAAQIQHAKGIQHFFLRNDKTKQFERVTDAKLIEEALNKGEEGSYYWIFTKDPSVQAFTDLLNRALDKPAEQITIDQNVTVIHQELNQRIAEGRKRAALIKDAAESSKPTVH
jgi:hypothetical protein